MKFRDQKYLNVDADKFISLDSPVHLYILGLLWADGYFSYGYKKKQINIELKEEDMNHLLPFFNKTGKWSYRRRERTGRKPQVTLICNNAKLGEFLKENLYDQKSTVSPIILEKISPTLRHYFVRGWVDGDGCFYHGKTSSQFSITGTYEQDWSALENWYNSIGVKYTIRRETANSGNRYSNIKICQKHAIRKIGQSIYVGEKIFLPRKFSKWKEIVDSIKHQ